MNRYDMRGVSAQKEDVHKAIAHLDKGIFPNAFCKIFPDLWGNDPLYCNIMHADGAGTKSVIAYMYWKETGDLSVWEGIAIDSIVMNIDDMLCVGAMGPFSYSSTIGRNKNNIPGEVIAAVINGTKAYFDRLAQYGIDVTFAGGETADVGDLVRTIIVDGTMATRMARKNVVTPDNIVAGDVVVSFSSSGQAVYEDNYNSGIGSNGLTSARHELLHKQYATKYPESVDPNLPEAVVYNGAYQLTDPTVTGLNIGQMLLSPTRTYAPLVRRMLANENAAHIHGIIHCSGGGQTKILHYLPQGLRVIKDNLLPTPPMFQLIQESAGTAWREMYQVFNMGQRLEVYTTAAVAPIWIEIAKELGIEATISGRVETATGKELIIESGHGSFRYGN